MSQLRTNAPHLLAPLAIGISGQMHGEVLADEAGKPLSTVRLWCDHRNADEGALLTGILETKIPKRQTCARFFWTAKNHVDLARQVRHITTPAGWTAYRLTGFWNLG